MGAVGDGGALWGTTKSQASTLELPYDEGAPVAGRGAEAASALLSLPLQMCADVDDRALWGLTQSPVDMSELPCDERATVAGRGIEAAAANTDSSLSSSLPLFLWSSLSLLIGADVDNRTLCVSTSPPVDTSELPCDD